MSERDDKPQSVADITELYRFIEAGLSPLAASRRRALEELKDAAIRSLPSAAALSDPSPIDREWWRKQGIEACLDRMVLINERRRELELTRSHVAESEPVAWRWRGKLGGSWKLAYEPWSEQELLFANMEQEPLFAVSATPLNEKKP
jgi:hypothetical protein